MIARAAVTAPVGAGGAPSSTGVSAVLWASGLPSASARSEDPPDGMLYPMADGVSPGFAESQSEAALAVCGVVRASVSVLPSAERAAVSKLVLAVTAAASSWSVGGEAAAS